MLEQIKQVLQKVTHGDDWTHMTDAGIETKVVAEYDRLTENMGGLIATCENVATAEFIANAPEWLRYLIGEVERTGAINKAIANGAVKAADDVLRLESQVEELQKALKQWEDFANHLTNITSCSMTKNEIRQALNTFAERSESK